MIKKTLSILALSTLPALVFAAGEHMGGHNMPAHGMEGHDMSTMSQATPIYGQPGDSSKVSRTIEVTMDDSMRFTPSQIDVKQGETVRFFMTTPPWESGVRPTHLTKIFVNVGVGSDLHI